MWRKGLPCEARGTDEKGFVAAMLKENSVMRRTMFFGEHAKPPTGIAAEELYKVVGSALRSTHRLRRAREASRVAERHGLAWKCPMSCGRIGDARIPDDLARL